eukprot:TRINITY_DN15271_c0_g1_i1.p1 TRINITY_DN15271_c0_g1~~TRINITY_DN15271_c0_g1_i1.p1  ORF type:complete len:211 (-),score=41.87 TRINITY_DN15271_c0_g1_i1:181-789(-)
MVGNAGVGKSSLLLRYTTDIFKEQTKSTIGVDFKNKIITIEGEPIKLQIWDTAGAEKFSCVSKEYYRGLDGCVLVYDISDTDSFNRVDFWYQEVLTYSHTVSDPILVLVGNKSDKEERQVDAQVAATYAKEKNMSFFETSAKLNKHVNEPFENIAIDLMKQLKSGTKPKSHSMDSQTITLTQAKFESLPVANTGSTSKTCSC